MLDWKWVFALSSLSGLLLHAVTSRDEGAIKALVSEGADVNARNSNGQTPLVLAIVSGQDHVVRLLLESGADPFLRDHTELNAIDWAERKGRSDLAHILRTNQPRALSHTKPSEKSTGRENKSTSSFDEIRTVAPLSSDEKSRKWILGIKQRFEEQADSTKDQSASAKTNQSSTMKSDSTKPIAGNEESKVSIVGSFIDEAKPEISKARPIIDKVTPEINKKRLTTEKVTPQINISPLSQDDAGPKTVSQTDAEFATASQVEAQLAAKLTSKPSSNRKRCPECNTVYNSELLAYCAYHVVPLVDADEPILTSRSQGSSALLWILVVITLGLASVVGLFLSGYLYRNKTRPDSTASPITATRQGIPVLGSTLSGKSVNLPAAEVTVQTQREAASITVQVKINRRGQVIEASSIEGDQMFREAAIAAAKSSTFSVQKLRGRGTEGTITYTFNR